MNLKSLHRVLACAALVIFALGCGNASKPEATERKSEDVVAGMRLKQLAKNLELTDEQRGQVKVLLDDEAKEIGKIHSSAELSITQQAMKIGELQKETYGKIKPLLTPVQLEKLEKMLSRTGRRQGN